MTLHPAIQAYFEADKHLDGGAPLHAFTRDAVITDEGHSQTGHEAIDTWWRSVKAKYQAVAEPFEVNERADTLAVRAKVSGQFPGSPLTLTYAFRIEDDKIASLVIGG